MKYQDLKNGRFYWEDCFDVMKDIPDGVVDMILCDLPYGTTQNKWDSVLPLDELWREYWRIAKPNAAIVLTASQPFTSRLVMHQIENFKQELVWCKNAASDFLNANRRHMAKHESVLLFARGKPPFNPQLSPGDPYVAKRRGNDDTGDNYGSIAKRTDTVNKGDRKPTTLLQIAREHKPIHPTQKPIALFEYLIKTYTDEGQLVLDNTAGSGTTAIAAINTNRRWVCVESDEEYANRAIERIVNHAPKATSSDRQSATECNQATISNSKG